MHEITFLGSRDVIGAKRFTPVETIDYACGFGPYSVQRREVEDLAQLLNVLQACTANWFYVRGDARGAAEVPYRRKLAREEQPATLFEKPLTIVPIDIDGGACALDASLAERVKLGRELLPPEFRVAACIAQATASCKIKAGLRIRLFYICERGVSNAECKQLLDGIADVGIYSAEHVTYVCAPQFDGVADPFAGQARWLMVEGEPLLKWPAGQEALSAPVARTEAGPIGVGDRHRMLTVHAGQLARLKLPPNVIEDQLVAFSEHAFSEPLPASRRGEIAALARRAGEWSEDAPAMPAPPREGEVVISLAAEKALRASVKRVRLEPKCWRGEVAKLALFAARAQLSADTIVRELSKEGVGSVTTEEITAELTAQVALVAGDEGVFEPSQRGGGVLSDVMPQLKCSDTGAILKSGSNMRKILGGGQFALWLNSRTGETVLQRAPWAQTSRAVQDRDIVEASCWLEDATGWLNVPADPLKYMQAIAATRPHDPFAGWLEALQWDGVPRMQDAARRLLGATEEREQYFLAWWLISAVARTLKPGCQAEYVIVLEGEQGARKTSFLRELVGTAFYRRLPGQLDASNPRVIGRMHGAVVVELAELSALKRSEVEQVKEFIDSREDTWQPLFSPLVRTDPRMLVFAGTTNNKRYLKDFENRRFWPIAVTAVDLAALAAERAQLWAEAVARYRAGVKWWPEPEDVARLGIREAQEERREVSENELIVDAIAAALTKALEAPRGTPHALPGLDAWKWEGERLTVLELKDLEGITALGAKPKAAQLADALRVAGWRPLKVRPVAGGSQVRAWVRSHP